MVFEAIVGVLCLYLVFLVDVSCPLYSPQCPPSQRYDVHLFPPRCLDCPNIIRNPMHLFVINARVESSSPLSASISFNTGVPQNKSCGCWKPKNKRAVVIDIGLNASWVVSGLSFYASQKQWLRRFSVSVSGDNRTFLDWGTYTHSNYSTSRTVLFQYPVRAKYFRLFVLDYVNHMINHTTGFPVHVNALVSNSEPFGCSCASLSTGECCPHPNMEVKNDTCMTCMDPTDIHTVVVGGCGRCKAGTIPLESSSTRCVPVVQYGSVSIIENNFRVFNKSLSMESDTWMVYMDVESKHSTMLVFFLTTSDESPCIPPISASMCLKSFSREFKPILWDVDLNDTTSTTSHLNPVARTSRGVNLQYLQFDRGRFVLVMNRETIRAWAQCDSSSFCIGNVGVLFINALEQQSSSSSSSLLLVDVIRHPLIFQLEPPISNSVVLFYSRYPVLTSVEIHYIVDKNHYLLWSSASLVNVTAIQWDDNPYQAAIEVDGKMTIPPPPLNGWSTVIIFTQGQKYIATPPIPVVEKCRLLSMQVPKRSVQVRIVYGLALKSVPEAGDTEQLITISAVSKEPVRLTRLISYVHGSATVYTSPKGFITDTRRVLDLMVACNGMMSINSMVLWLESILGLMDSGMEPFVTQSCGWVNRGEVSRLYWLIPFQSSSSSSNNNFKVSSKRSDIIDLSIEAEFS